MTTRDSTNNMSKQCSNEYVSTLHTYTPTKTCHKELCLEMTLRAESPDQVRESPIL
jgi:hypothetical protein